jgi:hypothetical protein
MALFTRLFEKLTGRPHQHQTKQQVNEVANDLRQDARRLQSCLEPYTQSNDPLVSLMIDVFNRRQQGNGKGNENGDGD